MTEVGPAIICPKTAGEKLELNTCGVAAPLRETRVVDESGQECAPGVAGELQIRGRAIMLGYYKHPDANAEAFHGDWFRAGENISASEVEAAMREAPQIAEAAAIAVPDELRREEVMVLVKLAGGITKSAMPPEAIRAHSERLAAFKRPRYIAYVAEFPRTATNKISKTKIGRGDLDGLIFDCQTQSTDNNYFSTSRDFSSREGVSHPILPLPIITIVIVVLSGISAYGSK